MKKHLLPLFAAGLLSLATGCYDEDAVPPSGNYSTLRFEFPQGDNPWDHDAEEIYEKYQVYLLYKDITDYDLNRK